MPSDPEIVGKIRDVLQNAPGGQSISQISQKIGANRNVTAKYLDILETNGQVESQAFGSARVFFLPRSVPVSTILGLSNDLICTIDNCGCMTFANERFIEFFGLHPGKLYHVPVRELPYPYEQWMGLQERLLDPERDKEADRIIRVTKNGGSTYFRKKIIMTRFEDGSMGRILIFSDVTGEQEHLKNLEFLARTASELADMGDDADLYQYIADRVAELEPKAHVMVNSINPEKKTRTFQSYAGDEECTRAMFEYLGDMRFGSLPMDGSPEAIEALSRGTLYRDPSTFFAQAYRALPEHICNTMQERLNLTKGYAMGCTCRGGLFGNIAIRYRNNDDVRNWETIEAFVRQAGVALQRRHMREKLRHAEERISELEGVVRQQVSGK
ncbi:MAG: PAS domain-containing protein [Methanomicrobiales archaeon]